MSVMNISTGGTFPRSASQPAVHAVPVRQESQLRRSNEITEGLLLATEDVASSDYATIAGRVVLKAIVAHFPVRREDFAYDPCCSDIELLKGLQGAVLNSYGALQQAPWTDWRRPREAVMKRARRVFGAICKEGRNRLRAPFGDRLNSYTRGQVNLHPLIEYDKPPMDILHNSIVFISWTKRDISTTRQHDFNVPHFLCRYYCLKLNTA